MGLYPELDGLKLAELIARFDRRCPEGAKYATAYRMEIAASIRKFGSPGTSFLRRQLRAKDTSRVRSAIFGLSERRAGSLSPRELLRFLADGRGFVVAEALDGLTTLKYRNALEKVRPLSSRSNPYIVGAALRHISAFDKRAAKPLLLKALRHRSSVVKGNACDLLDSLNVTEAIPHLIPLLRDKRNFTRLAARTAIENLREKARQ